MLWAPQGFISSFAFQKFITTEITEQIGEDQNALHSKVKQKEKYTGKW